MPAFRLAVEAPHILCLELLQIAERHILPAPEADLAEARVAAELQPLRRADGLRRFSGAVKIACVAAVDRDFPEPRLQGRNLPQAVRRNQGIILAMNPSVGVPLRLRMANQINRCHKLQ